MLELVAVEVAEVAEVAEAADDDEVAGVVEVAGVEEVAEVAVVVGMSQYQLVYYYCCYSLNGYLVIQPRFTQLFKKYLSESYLI